MQNFAYVSHSAFSNLRWISQVKGAKLVYSRFIKSHAERYFDVDGQACASIAVFETTNSDGQAIERSLDLDNALKAIAASKSISQEDRFKALTAIWEAIHATDIVLDAPEEEVVEEKPARKPMFEIVGASTITVNEPKKSDLDEAIEKLDTVVEEKIEAATTQDDIVDIEDIIEETCENLDEADYEVITKRYRDSLESAWAKVVETVTIDKAADLAHVHAEIHEMTGDTSALEDLVDSIEDAISPKIEMTEEEKQDWIDYSDEILFGGVDPFSNEETFEEILEEDIVEEIVITAENFEEVITAAIVKAEVKTHEEKATEKAELDRIEDLIEDAWGLNGVPNQNHILSGLEQRLNQNYYLRTRNKEDAENEAVLKACNEIQIENDLERATKLNAEYQAEEARQEALREEVLKKQREDYLREQAESLEILPTQEDQAEDQGEAEATPEAGEKVEENQTLKPTPKTSKKTLEKGQKSPIIEPITNNAYAHTTAEETEMLSINYTKTQKDIIETVIENFDLDGEVVMLSTKVKFGRAFGEALKARLERLVKMNRRSINSIVKKLGVALSEVEETSIETTPPGGAFSETPVSEVSEDARLSEQVEEKIEHVVPDSINPVEKPMNATQRRVMSEEELWEQQRLMAEKVAQREENEEPALFSKNFQQIMKEKQAARETRRELPADHWSRKPKEERRSKFISSNCNEETAQPIPQPVDIEDLW